MTTNSLGRLRRDKDFHLENPIQESYLLFVSQNYEFQIGHKSKAVHGNKKILFREQRAIKYLARETPSSAQHKLCEGQSQTLKLNKEIGV